MSKIHSLKLFGLLGLLVMMPWVFLVTSNASTLTADQQCSSISTAFLNGIGGHQPAGQTFTPTQTSLVGFSFYIQSVNGADTPMTANVRLGGIGGAVLASFVFTVPGGFGSPTGDWFLVQFPSGVRVTPGSTYALDLVDNSGSSGIRWYACSTSYTNGCGYQDGSCTASSWAFIEYSGDFSIALSTSSMGLVQGSAGTAIVSVNSVNNFASPVTLTVNAPSGIVGTFSVSIVTPPAGGTGESTLTVLVPSSVGAGTYPITIVGTSGPTSHAATLSLTVFPTGASDFSVSASPSVITVGPGTSATSKISVSSFDGFNSQVSLAEEWVGTAPVSVSLALPSPVTPPAGGSSSSTLTVNAATNATTGTFILRVDGTSGTSTHSVDLTIIVAPAVTTTTTTGAVIPDFTITASSTSISIIQGLSGSTTVIVASVGGFSDSVAFSASWVGSSPSGVTFSLPSPITPPPGGAGSSPMAISSSSTASTGSYTLRITGTSGSVSHSLDLAIDVSTPGPRCIIATATYGSELAPQVQLLRSFRDNSVMRTSAGSNFMVAFNAWYYSFSPQVANYIATHSLERSVMKVVLYPLIGILALSYGTFQTMNSQPELAIVSVGILASSMIGAFYLGLPLSLVRAKVRRLHGAARGRTLERLLTAILLGSVGALAVGELLSSSLLLMGSAAAVVLSSMLLSAAFTSRMIMGKLCKVQIN